MAGSYRMARTGWCLIENMGDAYEATEEMLWLIERAIGRRKAEQLLKEEWYPMLRGERPKDAAMLAVTRAMEDADGPGAQDGGRAEA